ncbi:TonB-dependent receptor domain-containing protein [Brevundimonas variabilis]|uniref:TonB-dependent receptor domain-containing protein n=1 Tax=Brevundimonas variabilis TaxID=74312 RepID=UPI001605D3BE
MKLGLKNTGDTTRQGARIGVRWRIADSWNMRLGYVAQTLHSDDTQYAFKPLGGDRRALSLQEPSGNDFDGLSATLSGDLGWAHLKINTAVQSHGLDRRYDATVATDRFGGAGRTAYDESDSIEALVTEATLSSQTGGQLNWLVGLFATEYSHDRTGDVTQQTPVRLLYENRRRDHVDETALYGQAAWALTDRLKITAGARVFRLGVETQAVARQAGMIIDTLDSTRSDSGIAPKLVIEYALRDNILVYVQGSEGYRAGGFNTGTTSAQPYGVAGGLQPYRQFRSDELVSYEAGTRFRVWDDRLVMRLALFGIDWRTIQSDRIGTDGLPFTGNIGNARNLGVEGELAWVDGPWRIDANLMFAEPELDSPDPGFPIPADTSLSGVPNLIANVAARRALIVATLPAWVSGSVGYVGASNLIFSADGRYPMGDYWTSDLAAGIDLENWSVSLRLENVSGSRANTFAYGNPFLVGVVDVTTPQRPASLIIGISRRF